MKIKAVLIIQALFLMAVSPLVSGLIKKIKNEIRMKKGPGILQPYYNIMKLFAKEEIISENTSWIFRIAPIIVLASSVSAVFLISSFIPGIVFEHMGDAITLVFILALGRFFIALAGLDAGSAFCGMGSSREMFISAFAEPVLITALFAAALGAGTANIPAIAGSTTLKLSYIIAASAIFIVMLAETSRLPVDNRETHLELTMVHEAMLLEYSGRSLALIELASHIKQIIFFSIIALLVPPYGIAGAYILKIIVIAAAVALVDVTIAKMRLFRVTDLFSFAFMLAVMALIAAGTGR